MVARDIDYRPQGAALQLFTKRFRPGVIGETLIEGGAGTGKTRGVLEYVNYLCEEYPGVRGLMVRKTRKSMNESVLPIFEDEVLLAGNPAITGTAKAANRDDYTYENGSHLVLAGMDHPERIMSAQYDFYAYFEATEGTLNEWDLLGTRLRWWHMPWQEAIADCNPGAERHWLNRRANAGMMQRLLSRHEDNPTVQPGYLDRLSRLPGARRQRLYLHKWVTEEGQVWENFDPLVHCLIPSQAPELRWYFASVDWGWRHAGVLQVWGVDAERRLYMVAEVYKTGKLIDWWAKVACELYAEFKLRVIVCDPSRPDAIAMFNDRLGEIVGRNAPRIAREADNKKHSGKDMGGLDLVRWAFEKDATGKPHTYFVRDSLRHGRDEQLSDEGRACTTVEEIDSYVWTKNEEGKAIKEETDPLCQQDGCDATRYGHNFAWGRDLSDLPKAPRSAPGTYGHETGFDDWLDKARAWDQAHGLTPAI